MQLIPAVNGDRMSNSNHQSAAWRIRDSWKSDLLIHICELVTHIFDFLVLTLANCQETTTIPMLFQYQQKIYTKMSKLITICIQFHIIYQIPDR